MRSARHLHVAVGRCVLIAALTIAALAAFGCGSSGSSGTESSKSTSALPASGQAPAGATARGCTVAAHGIATLRATGATCATAAEVAASWTAEDGCRLTARTSRSACTVGRYRCLSASTDRGLAVSCARPGRSISFVARRG